MNISGECQRCGHAWAAHHQYVEEYGAGFGIWYCDECDCSNYEDVLA